MNGFILLFIVCSLYFNCNAAYVKEANGNEREIGVMPVEVRNNGNFLIEIYYETKCPDSARFITTQLDKALPLFSNDINFRLIPFGKANYTQSDNSSLYDFNCQHGPQECYGNIIHNCFIDRYKKIKDHFSFINCTMNNLQGEIIDVVTECLRSTNVSYIQLANDCANQTNGNSLMYQAGLETNTLNPSLTYVPWINVNKQHTNEIQKEAETNLIDFICKNYEDASKLNVCKNSSNSLLETSFSFTLLISLLLAFV